MKIECIECGKNIPYKDEGKIVCPHCKKINLLKECTNCLNYFSYEKNEDDIICPHCGFNHTTNEDDGADLFPNGRDFDAEDEDTFGGY